MLNLRLGVLLFTSEALGPVILLAPVAFTNSQKKTALTILQYNMYVDDLHKSVDFIQEATKIIPRTHSIICRLGFQTY